MNNRRTALLNIIFFLIHLLAYAYFSQQNSWNTNSRYGLTMAIVERGTLSIDAYHNSLDWFTGDISAYKGHYYSDKPPGTAFLGVLFFWPVYEFCKLAGITLGVSVIKFYISITSIAIPSAGGALLVFLVAQKIAGKTSLAFWASMAVTLGSMFWPFSVTFMSHALTSVFIFAAFFLGFQFYSSDKIPDRRSLFFIGLTMGFAFITEYTVAIVILWVLGYLLFKGYQHRHFIESFLLIGLGSLIAVLPAVVYNLMVFHAPLASGYSHLVNKQFATGMASGLLGIGLPDWKVLVYMTIHPTQGIFWESPALFLIIPAYLKISTQKYKAELIMALGIAVSMLVILSGYYIWWGGESFAPRHLTPIMLFLVIPLAALASKIKPWLIISTIFSILQMFLVVSTSLFVPDTWVEKLSLFHPFEPFRYTILYNTLLPQFLNAGLSSNLGKIFIANPFAALLPFIILESALGLWFYLIQADRLMIK